VKKRSEFQLATTGLVRGTTLIEASAGTGKTYTIAGLTLRLILDADLTIEQILVTTFTEAATAELRERIRARLQGAESAFVSGMSGDDPLLASLLAAHQPDAALARLRTALRDFDRAAISTIHGFCQRMLREHAFESGLLFDTELITDQAPLFAAVVEDFWRRQFYECEPVITAITGARKWTIASLTKLLREAAQHPFLQVRPTTSAGEFARKQKALCKLSSELRELWRNDEAAIRACIFTTPPWASRTPRIGRKDSAEKLFEQIGRALSESGGAWIDFDALRHLASSALEKARLKKGCLPAHKFFELCEKYATLADELPRVLEAHFLRTAMDDLRRQKALRNVMTFDDLLTQLFHALEKNSLFAAELARRYPAALIDEFQDTDPVQAGIFERIYAGRESYLYLIGDPKQAIYGFRGADVFSYLKAATRADAEFTLLTNRRSETGMVEAVNHIFKRSSDPFLLENIQFQKASAAGARDLAPLRIDGKIGPALDIWAWSDPDPILLGEANRVAPRVTAAEIARLLAAKATIGERPVVPSDIAVLIAANFQAAPVQAALGEFGIASRLVTDVTVFATREATELHIVLTAIMDPSREVPLRTALATELLGLTAADLTRLSSDERGWEQRLTRFQEYRDRWLSAGFIVMFQDLLTAEEVRPRLLGHRDGERRLTNLLQLGELVHTAALSRRFGVRAVVKWLGDRLVESGTTSDEMKLRLERDDDAVAIITVHRCKGLEFPIVFCPFIWGRPQRQKDNALTIFHDPEDSERALTLDLPVPPEASTAAFKHEHLAQDLRLLYVALTRARHRCHLLWGRFNECYVSAAARLFHRPPNGEPNAVAALETHIKSLSDARFTTDLAALAAESGGTIAVRPLPSLQAPLYRSAESTAKTCAARRFRTRIDRSWRLSSFTSLTSGRDVEPRDYDAAVARPDAALPAEGITAFPAGKRAGSCLHAMFERIDFNDAAARRACIDEQLAIFRYHPSEWGDVVARCLDHTLAAPLPGGFSLREVPRAAQLREVEFCFSAARLDATALRAIADSETAGRFHFEPRRGLVKGFIDLVFEHRGQWFIVDWKSNQLGTEARAYEPAALRPAMARHHYGLQYLIYTVALNRWLARRPDYNYESHFGGVFYLFLRGIDPTRPSSGIFYDRPSLTALEALEAKLSTG